MCFYLATQWFCIKVYSLCISQTQLPVYSQFYSWEAVNMLLYPDSLEHRAMHSVTRLFTSSVLITGIQVIHPLLFMPHTA